MTLNVLLQTLNKVSSSGWLFPPSPRNLRATHSGLAADHHPYLFPSPPLGSMSFLSASYLHHCRGALKKDGWVLFSPKSQAMLCSHKVHTDTVCTVKTHLNQARQGHHASVSGLCCSILSVSCTKL